MSGRVNVIQVDPTATVDGSTVVFIGTDGGGVWKTTNCCTANTAWRVVTDFPEIDSMSISDLKIDQNNPLAGLTQTEWPRPSRSRRHP